MAAVLASGRKPKWQGLSDLWRHGRPFLNRHRQIQSWSQWKKINLIYYRQEYLQLIYAHSQLS